MILSRAVCMFLYFSKSKKELSIELRERIVARHRFGEGYQKMSAALKVPKNTVVWNQQDSS